MITRSSHFGKRSTGLNNPIGVALDSAGNLYVANFKGHSITVYASGASGTVTPTRTVSGNFTGLGFPTLIFLR
jgi:DNA-binding beta-propeller fold protein YncE